MLSDTFHTLIMGLLVFDAVLFSFAGPALALNLWRIWRKEAQ